MELSNDCGENGIALELSDHNTVEGNIVSICNHSGWIYSAPGAYIPDPALEGKATFGFVSKYKKNAIAPDGQSEFQFKAGDLNFHSSSYEWLVVNQGGANAQFKGSGTINGDSVYKFMIWAGDDEQDTFRIRIWSESNGETTIYDNGAQQEIGGGGIVIHTKK